MPRILNPVVRVLDDIPRMVERDAKVAEYVEAAFGGPEECRRLICLDFFRHAFDGAHSFYASHVWSRVLGVRSAEPPVPQAQVFPTFQQPGQVDNSVSVW